MVIVLTLLYVPLGAAGPSGRRCRLVAAVLALAGALELFRLFQRHPRWLLSRAVLVVRPRAPATAHHARPRSGAPGPGLRGAACASSSSSPPRPADLVGTSRHGLRAARATVNAAVRAAGTLKSIGNEEARMYIGGGIILLIIIIIVIVLLLR